MRIFLAFFVFLLPFVSFAYSESTTHPGLTDEIIDLFNLYYPDLKISDEHKEQAKKGSTDEDNEIRMFHHFYDPVYKRGLEMTGTKWQSSKDWSEDTMAQARFYDQAFAGSLKSYFSSNSDHTWQRAIYEYAWGDKERAIYDLGHVLHLIEDASVPDHTRNDPHPPWFDFGSPYEAWTAQFDSEKLEGLAKSLYGASRKPVAFGDLQRYFDSMASYSNNNFFSKDTIFHEKYEQPITDFEIAEKLKSNRNIIVGYKIVGNDSFRLVGKPDVSDWLDMTKTQKDKNTNFILDNDHLIISDYWSRLSKQAVLHGAGVVKLFFDEVEKEKQSKVLFNKNKSFFARAFDFTKGKVFGMSLILFGGSSSLKQSDLDELLEENPTPQKTTPSTLVTREEEERVSTEVEESGQVANNQIFGSETSENLESSQPDWFPKAGGDSPSPGFGGGGSVSDSVPTPGGNSGNDGIGVDNGEVDEEETESEPADITAPEISFTVAECANSISLDGCFVVSPNISILWSSASSDVASYDVECSFSGSACSGFSFFATSATSTSYTLSTDEKTYELKARARDTTGNTSDWSTISVDYYSNPVVINEIAWGGTSASSADEWIELYNRTGKNISLSGWKLYAADYVPYINLSGIISANGYYLIERTDDNSVSDVSADLITPFSGLDSGSGLSNSGEVLILSRASTTVDQTVLCNSGWCGGWGSPIFESMERIYPEVSGTITSNWRSMDSSAIKNGLDANGSSLNATPRVRNSVNYLILQTDSNMISDNLTLIKSRSPYIVQTLKNFVVTAGATLTIEPGVTVKMGNLSSLTVRGDIAAIGTSDEMITFTSTASNPSPGAWKYVRIESPSENSTISYVRFEYGGQVVQSTPIDAQAMVSVYQSTATISNSFFGSSPVTGLRVTNLGGIISGNTFSVGTTTPDNIGFFVQGYAPVVQNNLFSDNYNGMRVYESSATTTISNNTFSNNTIGLDLALAKINLDTLSFTSNVTGISSSNSTLSVSNPNSIIFTSNTSTTSPEGLF